MTPPCHTVRQNRVISGNSHSTRMVRDRAYFFPLILLFMVIWIVACATAANISPDTNWSSNSSFTNGSGLAAGMPGKNSGIDFSFDTNSSGYPARGLDSNDTLLLGESAAVENETLAYNLVDKGLECYYSKNMVCAFASFESAHRILPMDANILYVQAQAFTFQDRYDEALVKADAALELEPGNAALWQAKGTILKKMGRWLESELCFNRAGELDSSYEIPVIDRFPFNILIQYSSILVLIIGLSLLGSFFYFKEIRRP
jgi:tetratricopeptide (TPR) repeat protein